LEVTSCKKVAPFFSPRCIRCPRNARRAREQSGIYRADNSIVGKIWKYCLSWSCSLRLLSAKCTATLLFGPENLHLHRLQLSSNLMVKSFCVKGAMFNF